MQSANFYGDRPPEEIPAYSLPRAARILRLSSSTLRRLFPASRAPLLLSFSNLVEAFVLLSTRQNKLHAYLQRIDWENGRPARFYPSVRGGDPANEPRTIVLDPRRGFGQPIIAGTGIEARAVAARYRAGESMLALAADYGIHLEQIEDAIRCETRRAA